MKQLQIKESSNIHSMFYDSKTKQLIIKFHSGGVYQYEEVSSDVIELMLMSSSIGKAFHIHIKQGGYIFTKLDDQHLKVS